MFKTYLYYIYIYIYLQPFILELFTHKDKLHYVDKGLLST